MTQPETSDSGPILRDLSDYQLLELGLAAARERRHRIAQHPQAFYVERARFVVDARDRGADLEELAFALGLFTRERVRQIYNTELKRRAEAGDVG